MSGPCILVTGGCGYIGSHTITCLLQSPLNYSVVVVDNLANSSAVSLDRVAEICNLDEESRKQRLVFHNVDMCDEDAFRKVFEASPKFDACIHFAGLKVRFHEKRFVGKSLPMTLFVTQIRLFEIDGNPKDFKLILLL